MTLRALLAVAVILTPSLALATRPLVAKAIEAEIQAKGAKAAVADLHGGPTSQWDQVLARVRQGGGDWLQVATELLPGTDAADTEGLHAALSSALQNNPAAVLALLGPEAGIADVCFDRQIEPTGAQHQAFIARARAALLTVKSAELRPKRDACLAQLGSS